MKRGFTLAEVLITLVIIGVIAAFTIPVLHANYTEKEKVSKVKKNYSILGNAITRVKIDGGDDILDFSGNGTYVELMQWFDDSLKPYLVLSKICYHSEGCWNETGTKYLNGLTASTSSSGIGDGTITASLNDGTLINLSFMSREQIYQHFGIDTECKHSVVIFFDINGFKEPNTIGKDIYAAVFTEDGLVVPYRDRTSYEKETDCSSSGKGISCISKYLKN